MSAKRAIQICCALILGLAMYMPAARADVANQESRFTFNRPVQVADNMILPPGSYTFRLADMGSYPNNMVLIYDNNDGRYLGNVLTESASRNMPLANWPRVGNDMFTEDQLVFAPGQDYDTLVKWFYAGDTYGHEFTYSPQRERALTEQAFVTVMATPTNHHAPGSLVASNR